MNPSRTTIFTEIGHVCSEVYDSLAAMIRGLTGTDVLGIFLFGVIIALLGWVIVLRVRLCRARTASLRRAIQATSRRARQSRGVSSFHASRSPVPALRVRRSVSPRHRHFPKSPRRTDFPRDHQL